MLPRINCKATNAAMFSLILFAISSDGNHASRANELFFHDAFETNDSFDLNWSRTRGPGTSEVSSGSIHLDSPGAPTFWDFEPGGISVLPRTDWSFRALVTPQLTDQGEFWLFAIGTNELRHAGLWLQNNLRAGKGEDPRNRTTPIPYDVFDTPMFLQMDAVGNEVRAAAWQPGDASSLAQVSQTFDSTPEYPRIALWNGTASIHDVWISTRPIPIVEGDYDLDGALDADDLVQLSNAQQDDAYFDLTGDRIVDFNDHEKWVRDLKETWYGDANLDGEFTSSDFIQVFQADRYETNVAASWIEGDWNNDRRFNSTDFIIAFQDGGYEQGPRPKMVAVPEPSTVFLLLSSALFLVNRRPRQERYTPQSWPKRHLPPTARPSWPKQLVS